VREGYADDDRLLSLARWVPTDEELEALEMTREEWDRQF
jgi:hypothetical protein